MVTPIEMVLMALLNGGRRGVVANPYDWRMTCEQVREAVEALDADEFFNRPENLGHKRQLRARLKSHAPANCWSVLAQKGGSSGSASMSSGL